MHSSRVDWKKSIISKIFKICFNYNIFFKRKTKNRNNLTFQLISRGNTIASTENNTQFFKINKIFKKFYRQKINKSRQKNYPFMNQQINYDEGTFFSIVVHQSNSIQTLL